MPETTTVRHCRTIAEVKLGPTTWRVDSDCGVVKIHSSRDGCMAAMNSIEAEDQADVDRQILARSLTVPRQRVRRYAPRVLPREPVTRHGRTLVTRAIDQCGPMAGKEVLLKLDCGHSAYCDIDLWYPDNPYYECGPCARGVKRGNSLT